ncbi:MAG: Tad domain-containing protein [Aeromicrobium erythreum]
MRERGSVSTMTIGFVILIGLLSVVVVNASDAYLERQDLANLADGAALSAADGLDESDFYAGRGLDLDARRVRAIVADYVRDDATRVVEARVDDDTVTVRLERRLDLAFVPPGWTSGTTIVAEATAQLRPGDRPDG